MYKLSIILTIVVVALGSALSLSVDYGIRKNVDCKRLSSNQSALLGQIETFQVRDSLNGVNIRLLTMRGSEFEAHFESLNALIKDMGLRVKHVQTVSQSSTESQYEVKTTLRDSIISEGIEQKVEKSVQTINYADPHLSLSGVINGADFHGNIICRDTLTQIVHRIPRHFWFIKWGTKELRQKIVSSNPHTRIVYAEHIEIIK